MKYLPIFLCVEGRRCLVIGGGAIAQQKIESLLRAGARVDVISPTLTAALQHRVACGEVGHRQRTYQPGDLSGYRLAFAATNDETANRQIADEAAASAVLLNVVDCPALCEFIVPSIVERGDLIIATSTSGTSPALAKRIRQHLETEFGPEYAVLLNILGRLRDSDATTGLASEERQRLFGRLVDSPLLDYVRAGSGDAIDDLLRQSVGPNVTLSSLGVSLA